MDCSCSYLNLYHLFQEIPVRKEIAANVPILVLFSSAGILVPVTTRDSHDVTRQRSSVEPIIILE